MRGFSNLALNDDLIPRSTEEKGDVNSGVTIVGPSVGAVLGANIQVGPLQFMGPVDIRNSGSGGPGLSNNMVDPNILDKDPTEPINVKVNAIGAPDQSPLTVLVSESNIGEGSQHMVFGAQKSLFENVESTVTGSWKRRARNQQRNSGRRRRLLLWGRRRRVVGLLTTLMVTKGNGVFLHLRILPMCHNKVAVIPEEKDLLLQLQAASSTTSVISPQPIRPVGSSITVGCISENTSLNPAVQVPKKPEEVEEEVESESQRLYRIQTTK
ncbi:hypothetical protein LWI29_024461 [Acer saccharum]|uniref:Uncharacterized protein n=1 Tax=Acer saccharum TaxID=4024 RepID=A0AA39VYX2_ACESA|nr:hypothetical protein LWI29_024461 [Acer saccharum]